MTPECWYSPQCPALAYCSAARFLIIHRTFNRPFADGIDHTQQLLDFRLSFASRGVCPLLLPLPFLTLHKRQNRPEAVSHKTFLSATNHHNLTTIPFVCRADLRETTRDPTRISPYRTGRTLPGQPCYPVRRNRCSVCRYLYFCRGRPGFRCQHLRHSAQDHMAPAAYMPDTAAAPSQPTGFTMPPQSAPPPAPPETHRHFYSRQTRHDVDHGTICQRLIKRADNSVSPASRPAMRTWYQPRSVSDETPGAVWPAPG